MRLPEPDRDREQIPSLESAAALARTGDRRGALRILLRCLEATPLEKAVLGAAARLARELGFTADERCFAAVAKDPSDPEALYELGYLLIDSGVARLGASYLETCLAIVPDHPLVGYELGFARFLGGDHVGAEPLFERAFGDGTLPDAEAFSAGVQLVRCRALRGNLRGAREALERLERYEGTRDEAQVDALAKMLRRADRLSEIHHERSQGERDRWFVDTGSLLLHVPREGVSSLPSGVIGLDFLAGILRRLEAALGIVGAAPAAIVAGSEALVPLASALSSRLGVPVAETIDDPGPNLVLLRTPDDAKPHLARLRRSDDGSVVFALSLDPRRDYPLLPDVVGRFAEHLVVPWEPHIEVGVSDAPAGRPRVVPEDAAAIERLGVELADALDKMEGDADDLAAIESYYRPLRELLVANRPDDEPLRRMSPAVRVS